MAGTDDQDIIEAHPLAILYTPILPALRRALQKEASSMFGDG
jgi:hypothetical protein